MALARGVRGILPGAEVVEWSVADGGPGTLDLAVERLGAQRLRGRVRGPLGEMLEASWCLLPDGSALLEGAEACGLERLAGSPEPMRSSTEGVGDLLLAALRGGARPIRIGVGGSATTDGGAGILAALGARIEDRAGNLLPAGGGALASAARVDLSGLDPAVRELGDAGGIIVLADVENPLLGETGSARVYGPQKGAEAADLVRLEEGLLGWADLLEAETGRRARHLQGAGASGGLAFGLAAGLGATIEMGARWLLDAAGFDRAVAEAVVVLTCEGRWDGSSHPGKATAEALRRGLLAGARAGVICGRDRSRGMGTDPRIHVLAADHDHMDEGDLAVLAGRAVRLLLARDPDL